MSEQFQQKVEEIAVKYADLLISQINSCTQADTNELNPCEPDQLGKLNEGIKALNLVAYTMDIMDRINKKESEGNA